MKLNYKKIKKFKTPVRPTYKSTDIYEINIKGKIYRCERPVYKWSKLDQSLYNNAWFKEGELLYNKKPQIFFDQNALYWFPEKLTSMYLLRFYTKNPFKYINIMVRWVGQVKKTVKIVEEVHKTVYSKNIHDLTKNFKKMVEAFGLFYDTFASIYFVSDYFPYRFKEILMKFLTKEECNVYLSELLMADISKTFYERGYEEDYDTDSRGSTFGKTKPIVFYKEPKFFCNSDKDLQIMNKLSESKISDKLKREFYALRLIVPIAIQINEEAHLIEANVLTPHFRVLIENIAKIFLDTNLIKNKELLNEMSYEEILEKLKESAKWH